VGIEELRPLAQFLYDIPWFFWVSCALVVAFKVYSWLKKGESSWDYCEHNWGFHKGPMDWQVCKKCGYVKKTAWF